MMKKLKQSAFLILIICISLNLISLIISAVAILASGYMIDAALQNMGGYDEEQIKSIINTVKIIVLFIMAIAALIQGYFFFRLIKNRKEPQGQTYITVLLVFSVIGAIFNLMSISSDATALFSLAMNIAIITGCVLQKNYRPAMDVPPGTYGGGMYGSNNMYSGGNIYWNNNPYGNNDVNGNNNPYGNNNTDTSNNNDNNTNG